MGTNGPKWEGKGCCLFEVLDQEVQCSALGDRIHTLEIKPESQSELHQETPNAAEVKDWLGTHLDPLVKDAVSRALDAAMNQTVAQLSSLDFFRLPVGHPGLRGDAVFANPPVILSTSPSI